MDQLLFGDNQFFGINHMSEEKARTLEMRFQDTRAIIDVLDAAYEEGIRTFMCTTHDRIEEICDHMRANQAKYADFHFYPCMPYAHKYANAATDYGMIGGLMHFMPDDGVIKTAIKGGMSLARRDFEGLVKILIDVEMKMFKGLSTPGIFLQNVIVDLLLGMGMKDALRIFHDHVREKYDAEPGYITMNMPALLEALNDVGIENPVICSNINKIGFRTSGGLEKYLETLRTRKLRAIAMSVYASGAIEPREAIKWISEQPNIHSIVFGASSRKNIRGTKELVDEYFPARSGS